MKQKYAIQPETKKIIDNLRNTRIQLRIPITEMVRATGISHYSYIENGRTIPTLDSYIKILKVLYSANTGKNIRKLRILPTELSEKEINKYREKTNNENYINEKLQILAYELAEGVIKWN